MRPVGCALASAVVLLAGITGPAAADVDPLPGGPGQEPGIRVRVPGLPGAPGPEPRSSSGRRCEYARYDAPPPDYEQGPGYFLWWQCDDGSVGEAWVREGRPLAAAGTLAREASRYLSLPAPRIATNPPLARSQLVHVPTWLWLDRAAWRQRRATASVPGLSATVTATPVRVVWSMGDGGRVACQGPGAPFDPARPEAKPSCTYTYRRSSAGQPGGRYQVTATTVWRVRWQASNGETGALPDVTRSSSAWLRVAEVQALNVG